MTFRGYFDADQVARLFGVERRTVYKWGQRDNGFPEPAKYVLRSPLWRAKDVIRWGLDTGRIEASEAAVTT